VHAAATPRGIVAVELMTARETFADGLARRLGRPVRWLEPEAGEGSGPVVDAVAAGHLRSAAALLEAAIEAAIGAIGAAIGAGIAGEPERANPLDALPLDLEDRPGWDRAVLGAVRAIPRGEVRSYGDIARAIGRPGAARAVGGAVGRNPVAFLIPCHRVVAGDGTLGGYGGGWWGDHERLLDLKARLLAGEGISLPRSRSRDGRGR
jgi:O-6-methylguanine DNA methyltransferase